MTYEAPRKWSDVARIKQAMQRDLLAEALRQHGTTVAAARAIEMDAQNFRNTCGRLGVPLPESRASEERAKG